MGSYFISKATAKDSWRVIEEVWQDTKRKHLTVPKIAYEALGFRLNMSIEEARARVKQLNAMNMVERKKASATARRIEHVKLVETAFLPKVDANEFTSKLQKMTFGNGVYENRIISHWKFVQTMIAELQLDPKDYFSNCEMFYRYFIEHKMSLDYSRKVLRIVNLWGTFVCRKHGQFYETIPYPKGRIKEMINDTYFESENYVGESNPLTPELLSNKKDQLKNLGEYEWLYLSVWFGLRPTEIDALHDSKKYRIEHDKQKILWVYQSKLTSISRDKRWKGIPVLYHEQDLALTMIEAKQFKRPIYKTMHNVFGQNVTLYAGRKNFEDMMLDKGHSLEDISMWMGHQNIQTTWSKYRNRKRVGGFK